MNQKLNIVFLDTALDYGYAFSATNTKTEFMARGLIECGASITILNGLVGSNYVTERTVCRKEGFGDVITYPKNGNQLVSWLKNISNLREDLNSLFVKGNQNIVVLEAPDYHIYKVYCYYARKYGYKIVTISHEWLPTVTTTHPLRRPFRYLYTKTFGNSSDGILPISEYIIERIRHFNKPYLKVPVLAEFDQIVERKNVGGYFLYCVYAAYKRAILPLVDAYVEFARDSKLNNKLILVLGGGDSYVKVIEDFIKEKGYEDFVEIRRKVPYCELVELYRNALGLVIPLDPNSEQDQARFSQKIAEYVSSASPIISCKVGEVEYYFKDKESAVLCDYSKSGFSKAFKWIAEHEEEARLIGKNGFEVGRKYFDYKTVGVQLYDFMLHL